MRIAIDAMGGDNAPAQIIEGALQALPSLEPGDEIILVGNEQTIQQHIANAPKAAGRGATLRVHHASQVVTMSDSPVDAIRHKRDSSIVKMVKLAKDGHADALISAGNTGALVAAGVLMLKPLAGVERPGIACLLPSTKGAVLMCDAGANVQPKPQHLYQYAVMASIYCKALRNIEQPTVAILNIGTEDEKGTPLVKEVRDLIKADPALNFIGYVEGRDIPKHPCDVLITDGFTGNVTLKVAEGFSEALLRSMHKEAASDPDLLAKVQPLIARIMKRYDHEEAGGAMLLGVQGMFFKVHGSTGAKGIKTTVATVKSLSKLNVTTQIESHLTPRPA
jgi:glycerol-3-phosphate acyltransferase PlsX